MSRMSMFLLCPAVLMIAASLSGCGGGGDSDQPAATGGNPHAGHEQGAGGQAGQTPANTEVTEALAKLPPGDRAAAEKQRICPITDELLGSMGKPVKVTHQGVDVFLCCAMCEDGFREDPEKSLAKLNP